MEEDDWFSEVLGPKAKAPPAAAATTTNNPQGNNNSSSQTKPTTTAAATAGGGRSTPTNSSSAMPIRSTNNQGFLDASLKKKQPNKKNQPKKESPADNDFQKWLAVSPRDPVAAQLSNAIGSSPAISADSPPALTSEVDFSFEPIADDSTRFKLYEEALKFDEIDEEFDIQVILPEDRPFFNLIKKHIPDDEEIVKKFLACWKIHCFGDIGYGNLGDSICSARGVSLLSALTLYHDPKLWCYFNLKNFNYKRNSLFQFYAPTFPGLKPVMELWDASIMNGLDGFLHPSEGSFFYAIGMLLTNRDEILNNSSGGDLNSLIDSLRDKSNPVQCISVGYRAMKLTPDLFLQMLREPELDWLEYQKVVSAEPPQPAVAIVQKTLPPPPPQVASTTNKQVPTPKPVGTTPKPLEGTTPKPVATATTPKPSSGTTPKPMENAANWFAKTMNTTTLKDSFSAFTQKMNEALQGNIDDDEVPKPPVEKPRKRLVSTDLDRHLFVVEYPGARRLGLQLRQTENGLMVHDFDHSNATPGEAEEEGTVKKGDIMHSINGVSVSLLPPSVAAKIITKQERPLCIIFSTANTYERKFPAGLIAETKSIQHALLQYRLMSFYTRFGQGKLDEISSILDLYARHERALYRSLFIKYGEPAPGDPIFSTHLTFVSAREAINGGLLRNEGDEYPDDFIFVDVRTPEQIQNAGRFPCAFALNFDEKDAKIIKNISKTIAARSSSTKVCLLSNGLHRVYSLVDPDLAKNEKAMEDTRILKAAQKLAENSVNLVCVIRGGFAESFREAVVNGVDVDPLLVDGNKDSLLYKTCLAYAHLNFFDTVCISDFIRDYFNEFRLVLDVSQVTPPTETTTTTTSTATMKGTLSGENFGAVFQNLATGSFALPTMNVSNLTVPTLFKQTSGGSTSSTGNDRKIEEKTSLERSDDGKKKDTSSNANVFSIMGDDE